MATAFRIGSEPLAVDEVVLGLAEGLIEADPQARAATSARRVDQAALERARDLLAERRAVVRSSELEEVTGLSRYDLARQFRIRYGTSPYRYSLMRRLDYARRRLDGPVSLADLALSAGFADQAHFTRMFKSAYGVTPKRYARLRGGEPG